jgi:aminoglycoside 6-adenylyltransferase
MDYNQAIDRVVAWANAEENVRAVVLTGSAALGIETIDEFSDLDVELYTTEPSKLLNDDSWYGQFGEVLVVESLPNPGWHPTRLVYYVGGKIDFLVGPIQELPSTRYTRPFRILVDKDYAARDLATARQLPEVPPSETTFLRSVHWFYAAALMCARYVVRNEPWLAKVRDWDLKRELLQMIEWDHKTRYGWAYETWYSGKHLNQWVDDDIRGALDACWAGFAVADTARALIAAINLFETLRMRTAAALGVAEFDARSVRAEVKSILAQAKSSPIRSFQSR